MANVRVIPATAPIISAQERNAAVKRRVAFYARVSTDSSEQKTSYDAQVDYYTKFIQSHPEWQFAGEYTDEGISAVSTKRREGFRQMVADGLAGSDPEVRWCSCWCGMEPEPANVLSKPRGVRNFNGLNWQGWSRRSWLPESCARTVVRRADMKWLFWASP